MNSGSYAMEPISQDGVLVTVALAIVAVLAVLTIVMMIVGARKRAKRKDAEAQEDARIADLEARGIAATNTAEGTGGVAAPPPAEHAPAPSAAEPPRADARVEERPAPAPLADEPIPAAAPLDASPASVAADAPAGASAGDAGPVGQLKGLGPKIQARLAELGVTRVDQLAWLDDAEAEALDTQLGPFQGRMARDRWREQARLLAQGDRAGFEAQFGKLG
jgi:predicted flap endonuclease-1-like 5' DNA nuclease